MTEPHKAANRMLRERGYLVIGALRYCKFEIGQTLWNWAGSVLPFEIKITAKTNRADWNAQYEMLFGIAPPKHRDNGRRFYRAVRVKGK